MADPDFPETSDDTSPEDAELIDQLLAEGFTYARNGTVDGLAAHRAENMDSQNEGGCGCCDACDANCTGDCCGRCTMGAYTPPPQDQAEGEHLGTDTETTEEGEGVESESEPVAGALADDPFAHLSSEEKAGLVNLRNLFIQRPDLANQVNSLVDQELSGTPEAPPQNEPAIAPAPALPDFIDPDDPVAMGLWERVQDLSSRLEESSKSWQQSREEAQRAKVQADVDAAVVQFKASHPDLSDDEVEMVRTYTSANINVPGIMANYPGDPVRGIVSALEVGSHADPAVRDKVLGIQRASLEKEDKTRGRKLSSLGGGTPGTARQAGRPKKPSTWNEVSQRIAQELSDLQ